MAHFQLTKGAFTKLNATTSNCFTQWDLIERSRKAVKRHKEASATVSSSVISFYALCDARMSMFPYTFAQFRRDFTPNSL